MILQALTGYYEALLCEGKVAAPGWSPVKVSYALCLSADGKLERVISTQTEQQRGKKMVLAPQILSLPAPVKRTVGIAANFLCDNSSYLLGIDGKGKQKRTRECFLDCKALHEAILSAVDSPAAQAVLGFFRTWEPEHAAEHPALTEHLDELLSGGNLVFRTASGYAHEDPAICRAWEKHYCSADEDNAPEMICLVTGEKTPVEGVHPSIKGVQGAQSSGTALVSFNAPAFCSFGREQSFNAPTGRYAAFAYTTALNYLIADRPHTYRMGDATVVFWAKDGKTAYQDFFGSCFDDTDDTYDEGDLRNIVAELCKGHTVDYREDRLDPEMEFYILGLSPNAARLSVRFFLRNTFGGFLRNLEAHRERLRIVRPVYEKFETPSLKRILDSTVNQNSRNKAASPVLAGELLRAVLNDTSYPTNLLNGITLRIRAEQRDKDHPDRPFKLTWPRAAVLKAYYLKNPNKDAPKEVLTVSLNEASTNTPYLLGRLFSVLEAIQQSANPGINATIKDRYFNSASATPAVVFPVLINLAQKHLKKLNDAQRIHYDKQLCSIMALLGEEFPTQLNLPQQGAFQLGYYHQTQARYAKKEEN